MSCTKKKLIEEKVDEINEIIIHSTSDTISDCRTYFISDGNACGPLFIYGINNIDTALLLEKFKELGDIKEEYFNEMEKQGTPLGVCDLMYPDTIVIMDGKCRACFKEKLDECKDTSVLSY